MLPWSLWAENIFRFISKYFFRIDFESQHILKVFLETTLVHVSCSPDHYEPKIFFWFSKFATTLRYTILNSRFPPENAISEGRPPLCNTSSEAGAFDTGGTYRERLGPKIFEVKIFSNKIKVFLETTFVHVSCYSDHYELKIFFRFSKSATTLRYTNLD